MFFSEGRSGIWEQLGEEIRLDKYSFLALPEEKLRHCYYLEEGYVTAYTANKNGVEHMIYSYEPGMLLMAEYFLSGARCRLYYRAEKRTVLRKIPFEGLDAVLRRDQAAFQDVMKAVLQAEEDSVRLWKIHKESDADAKLCSLFLFLLEKYGEERDGRVVIRRRLTQEGIGKLAGMHRVTAVRSLGKLRDEGVLQYRDKFYVINDMEWLRRSCS